VGRRLLLKGRGGVVRARARAFSHCRVVLERVVEENNGMLWFFRARPENIPHGR